MKDLGAGKAILSWERLTLYDAHHGEFPMAPIPLPPPAAHQSLASKIFCLCCRDCEEPCAMDDSKVPSQTQEPQPSTCSRYQTRTPRLASLDLIVFIPLLPSSQKEEVASKNSTVDANEASRLPLGQPLIHPEKRSSSTSNNEYEVSLSQRTSESWPGVHMAHPVFQNLMVIRAGGDQNGPSKPSAKVPPSVIISSFLLLERNTHVCPRGFYKRNLNRYSQDHCPFQPCHIGRP
ncbi:testis-expressed protein 48 [Phoca vitulina]|uniref:testis-expressed protein 48 n=1 Tax=Phoca vitulina TaxID=9720 RepID=UPI001396608A|nr:testis-expressed protein 48 [Phoca vitulina]